MKNKAIVISILLNTCIAANVHANTLQNTNYFYFGSKFNTLQPNSIKKSDFSNFKKLYNNYWSHSLYGFLIGYQSNAYFGLEISYNNPILNYEHTYNFLTQAEYTKNILKNYIDYIKLAFEKKEHDEEEQFNHPSLKIKKGQPYANISDSYTNNSEFLSVKKDSKNKKSKDISEHKNSTRTPNPHIHVLHNKVAKVNIVYPQQNLEIVAKFSYPVLNSIDLYSRLGCSVNIDKSLITLQDSNAEYSIKNNVFPIISVGVQYKINQNFFSRIEFEKKIVSYSNVNGNNLNSINLHFIWHFQGFFSHAKYNNKFYSTYAKALKNLSFKKDL